MLKGAIVAVGRETSSDPLDGTISSVTVGFNNDLSDSPRPCNVPGMSGTFVSLPFPGQPFTPIITPPFETGTFLYERVSPPAPRPAREKWYLDDSNDIGTIDSVIRAAKRIDSVSISRMSNKVADNDVKANRPRIESPEIGTLAIGHMDAGVVWSGRLNSPTVNLTNDIQDDFTSIGAMTIGCVSPTADLWIRDFSLATITNLFGQVHMPELSSTQTLRVLERLGSFEQAALTTGCDPDANVPPTGCPAQAPTGFVPLAFTEDSPRAYWIDQDGGPVENVTFGGAEFASVRLLNPNSLAGAIIIDANNTTGAQRPTTHLTGDVVVGTSNPATQKVFSTNAARATADHLLPTYTTFPTTFGNGSVGLVPFGVHWAFSDSLNTGLINSGLNPPFACPPNSGGQFVRMELYGPLTQVNNPRAMRISQAGTSENYAAYMSLQLVGPQNRQLQWRANAPYFLPVNTFVVTRNNALVEEWYRCDVPALPPVAEFNDDDAIPGYDYTVSLDCPTFVGGPYDCTVDDPSVCEAHVLLCNKIDFNNNGLFPEDEDLIDFLSVLAGGACSTGNCDSIDYNNDGLFPDDLDLISLLSVLAGGPCFQ